MWGVFSSPARFQVHWSGAARKTKCLQIIQLFFARCVNFFVLFSNSFSFSSVFFCFNKSISFRVLSIIVKSSLRRCRDMSRRRFWVRVNRRRGLSVCVAHNCQLAIDVQCRCRDYLSFFSKSISVRWSQISLEQNVNEIYRSDEIEFPIISANGYSEYRSTTNYSEIGDIRLFIFYWLEWLSMFSLLFYWSEERGSSEILITDWRNWGST